MPTVLKPDPFSAVLLNSPALIVTEEQSLLIRKVLDTSSSDTRFADKAYVSIWKILTGGSVVPPKITSLTPNSATVGDPSFLLHVIGTGFTSGSTVVFNGGEEPTTYASATELTTQVDMSTVSGASVVPVYVSSNGVLSDPVMFTFNDVAARKAPVTDTTVKK
jgi:IPT/TIG domain